MLEFGASFKKARESRNVSIDKIAVETRISKRFLLAIENETFDVLPGGIFNRGFIRTYAGRLGLDPEEAIRTYEKISHTADIEPARQETERVRGKTTKIPVYYVALAGLLIFVGVYYVSTHRTTVSLVNTGAPAPESSAAKPVESPAPAPIAAPEPAPVSVAATAAAPTVSPAPAAPAAPAASVSNAPIVLELEVREGSWFRLASDGSAIVMGEVLPAGTTRRYTANNSMDVTIGNAAGVLLRVNGQPVSSLGGPGQVRTMTITAKTSAASLNVGSH